MRLIDADALLEKTQFRLPTDNPIAEIYAECVAIHRENIEEAPTIDAVPVVRCKDCKYSRERNSCEKKYLVEEVVICTNNDVHDDAWGAMYEDDFCSYGERKDDDE